MCVGICKELAYYAFFEQVSRAPMFSLKRNINHSRFHYQQKDPTLKLAGKALSEHVD